MKNSKYKFVPLIESEIRPKRTPTLKELNHLKNFYLILIYEGENQVFARCRFGKYIVFNVNLKEIGCSSFKISTNLTLQSPENKIHSELNRYYGAEHKNISIAIYNKMIVKIYGQNSAESQGQERQTPMR